MLFLLVSVGSSTSHGLFGSGLGCRFWNVARWEGFSDLSHGLSLNLVSISDTSCGLEQRSEHKAARLHIRLHEDSHVAIFFAPSALWVLLSDWWWLEGTLIHSSLVKKRREREPIHIIKLWISLSTKCQKWDSFLRSHLKVSLDVNP